MKRLKYFALAALVAFAACDEGDEVVVPDPVTGTITGVVQIDGAGANGITVTLSSGESVTTSASGTYTFSDVPEGAYTVSISGAPSDAAFPTTSAAAVISTTGQVVTVNFNGSFITTSAISASISVPGVGALSGATISISGQSSASQVTGASGTVTFSGLRAGNYTVAVSLSAADAALYDLASASENVVLDVDELEAVAFTATVKTISTLTGTLFIDELPKNDMFESTAEEAVAAANIQIIVEGLQVGVFDTIQTAADGTFELTGLPAANYRIALNTSDADIPGALAFGGTNASPVVTLGVADTEVVNFPFDIVEQKVTIGTFLGVDGTSSARTAALPGATVRIYPTEALASAFGGGFIGSGTTGASGEVTISFDREDDFQPGNPNASDNIVFAAITTPLVNLTQNGEDIIEIPFDAPDSLVVANDEFDYTASQYTIAWKIQEGDGDTYENIPLRALADTTILPAISGLRTDADGMVYLTATTDLYAQTRPENWAPVFSNENIPAAPPAREFNEDFDPAEGSVRGGYLFYDFDGLALPTDTVFVGTANISWPEVDVFGRVFREFNEEVGYQAGEDPFGSPIDQTRVVLESDQGGMWVGVDSLDGGAPGPGVIANTTGTFVFRRLSPDSTYRLVGSTNAAAVPSNWAILDEQVLDVTGIDGFDQAVYLCPLQDAGTTTYANCGTYAVKAQSSRVEGTILYRDGSPVPNGTEVRISVNADSTVQGRASSAGDTIVTTSGGTGFFQSNASIREGFYTVTALTDEPAVFFNPTTNGEPKEFEIRGATQLETIPDVPGFNTVTDAAFHAHRTDGTIRGYVVNDRDEDGNVIDVDEGLIGATVTLYADDGLGGVTTSADSIVGTATIDADGLFTFENLVTRRYIIEAAAPGTEIILSDGVISETQYSVTPDNLDIDINPAPTAALPFWDFETSSIVNTGEAGEQDSYFTFLFTDGTLQGTVINDEDDSPVSSMSIQLTRCDSYGAPLPLIPAVGDCTDNGGTGVGGTFEQGFSTTDGSYSFDNLREGVYQVTIQSASTGDSDGAFDGTLTTGNGLAGQTFVFFIDGRTDLEEILFRVDNP
jgi:hypothetical protein